MDPLIESFNIFTFCVCTFILILQIRIKLKRNNFSISEFVSLIFYFFYVLPILYDLLLGIPDYSVYDFIRFTKASHDIMSVIIYDLMVILIQFLFYYKFIRPINSYSITLYSNFKSYIYILLYILIYLPILLFFFFPNKEIFYIYSTLGQNRITESTDLYMLIHNSTVLSILALFIFMVLKNNGLYIYRFLPILFIDIWLNGKRFIVIIVVLLLIYYLFNNSKYSNFKRMFMSIFFVLICCLFNVFYQNTIRYEIYMDPDIAYTNFRVDYGRDDVLKMAIYSEINNQSVLEYPCQGLFFLSTFYIPREIWKNKPLTYTAYFTSALIDEPPEFQHFGMTTGIFDECISNFGIVIGILLSIFIVLQVTLCAIRFEDQIFKLISLLWSSLLLTNDINSFKVIGVVWCLYYFSIKKYNRI